jgi:hypothetical protein
MKPAFFVLPLAALAIGALGWFARREPPPPEISRLPAKSARDAAEKGKDPSLAARLREREAGDGIDWKPLFARQVVLMREAPTHQSRAFREKLLKLSAAELIAGLDALATAGLSDSERSHFERTLAEVLGQREPQLVLERFAAWLDDKSGFLPQQLAATFRNWSARDPSAAAAWLDRQLAAGNFEPAHPDVPNLNHLRFEAGLIRILVDRDPVAAARRLAALPEDHRARVFDNESIFPMSIRLESASALADLIRGQIPEPQRAATLATATASLVHQGGYPAVGDFLGKIEASSAERAAVVSRALEGWLTREEMTSSVEETRAWIVAQAPDDAGRLTGEALAHLSEWLDFSEMAEEALQIRQDSGRDDTLAAFLGSAAARQHRPAARQLIDQIADPAKREYLTHWLSDNPHPAPRPPREPEAGDGS